MITGEVDMAKFKSKEDIEKEAAEVRNANDAAAAEDGDSAELTDLQFSDNRKCPSCGKQKLLSKATGKCEYCSRPKLPMQPRQATHS
jgi:hypothetical protein